MKAAQRVKDKTVDIAVLQKMKDIVEVVKVIPQGSSSLRIEDQTVNLPVTWRLEDITVRYHMNKCSKSRRG